MDGGDTHRSPARYQRQLAPALNDYAWPTLLLANAAVAAGALVQGMAGFGMNLIALPLLMALDARLVPVPLLIAHLLLVVLLSTSGRRRIDREALGFALLGTVPGTLLGTAAILAMTLPAFQAFTVAVLATGIISTACNVHIPRSRLSLTLAGVLSGFCGTTTSVNGPPLGLIMVGKSELPAIRATLAIFLLASTALSLAALGLAGRIVLSTLIASVMLAPGIVLGFAVSKLAARRIGHLLSPRLVFLGASTLSMAIFLYSIFRPA
jgi:hypothetical protein